LDQSPTAWLPTAAAAACSGQGFDQIGEARYELVLVKIAAALERALVGHARV
jgi:hypothetical protein